ncbi:MAG: hypothetical protein HQL22_03210 [Candidatus Omnitrophica bacterium]|nr:hypothetical protein [Candidatus Omnitrophota bacterium]
MGNKIFIVGSGFSKALNPSYPLLSELTVSVERELLEKAEPAIKEHYLSLPASLKGNIEYLMTYLISNKPWGELSYKCYLNKALFKVITQVIAFSLSEIEASIEKSEEANWSRDLIEYIHWNAIPAITFNYDTLFESLTEKLLRGKRERYSSLEICVEDLQDKEKHIPIGQEYIATVFSSSPQGPHNKKLFLSRSYIDSTTQKEFENVVKEAGAHWTSTPPSLKSLRLNSERYELHKHTPNLTKRVKLHGSIDWEASWDEDELLGVRQIDERYSSRTSEILLIPPVLDKSIYYRAPFIKAQWAEAFDLLSSAEEIFIIGYSFPSTDISTRLLFQSSIGFNKNVKMVIVNSDTEENLKDSLSGFLKGANIEIHYNYCGRNDVLFKFVDEQIRQNICTVSLK